MAGIPLKEISSNGETENSGIKRIIPVMKD